MESALTQVMNLLAAFIDACTAAVIVAGVLSAALKAAKLRYILRRDGDEAMREVRLSLGRWLALSLELALASDILRSIVAPTWDDIGKLGAIVALRTVLNYFLEKEIEHGLEKKGGRIPVAVG